MAKTIYKPSNKKFSRQGAVTSGGRLERLKLDTITAANSKCIKGRRCKEIPTLFPDVTKVYKYPNGTYGGGKPRFTGWMFNGHHREVKGRVYNMVRYNQQPLGIPQLTANPPGKTCIKKCFPRTLNLGTNRPTAAGNRARIPGSICKPLSPCACLPAEDNNLTVGEIVTDEFYGFSRLGTGSPAGNLVPVTLKDYNLKWVGWQKNGSFPVTGAFYLSTIQGTTTSLAWDYFTSISFVDCLDNSIRTYYTATSNYQNTGGGFTQGGQVSNSPSWEWGINGGPFADGQSPYTDDEAYWSSRNGRTLKVYIDHIPKLKACPCVECSCNNIPYQSGQGLPCCN